MNIFNMKKSDFKDIPILSALDNVKECDSVVIIPKNKRHESGYRCMEFVFCKDGEPFAKSFGGSDVLHLNGIGGYGKFNGSLPESMPITDWNFDCLPCGYLHLWSRYKLSAEGLSDFSVYANYESKRK